MPITLQLYGAPRAYASGGRPLVFPTRKAQALVMYLAMRPHHVHSRESLANLFWSDSPDEQARRSLRQAAFRVRQLTADGEALIEADGDGFRINKPAVACDVWQLATLSDRGDRESLSAAATLYHAEFLEGFSLQDNAFEEWLRNERRRHRALALSVLARLTSLCEDGGDLEAALDAAGRLLVLDPIHEPAHRALMRLHASSGRTTAALQQFRFCADALRREFGVMPDAATRALYDDLRRGRNAAPPLARDGRSVLVVEDDPVMRALVTGWLSAKGYSVTGAEDGADALLCLGRQAFDLVVANIDMPVLDGLQLLQIMSQKQIRTPTIFLTAMDQPDVERRGSSLGAADYIRKPLEADIFLARVSNVLRR